MLLNKETKSNQMTNRFYTVHISFNIFIIYVYEFIQLNDILLNSRIMFSILNISHDFFNDTKWFFIFISLYFKSDIQRGRHTKQQSYKVRYAVSFK